MVWVKLTDNTPLEHRHMQLSAAANWMLVCMLSYVNRELTDGDVQRNALDLVQPGKTPRERGAALAELERAGAILATTDGWRVVWHMDEQPTRQQVEDRQAADVERQRRKRERDAQLEKAAASRRDKQRDTERESHRVSERPDPGPDPKKREEMSSVFDHWVKVMGKAASAKLTPDRVSKIRARLRDGYTVADLCQAVDGCKLSTFHMGENDNRTAYNDLATILKSGAAVDAHRQRAEHTASSAAPTEDFAKRVAQEAVCDH